MIKMDLIMTYVTVDLITIHTDSILTNMDRFH